MLDMSMDTFQAYVLGVSDALFDRQLIAVQTGYWAGYYSSGSKHLKSVKKVTEELVKEHQSKDKKKDATPKPDVDVEAFKAKEAQFWAKMNPGGET